MTSRGAGVKRSFQDCSLHSYDSEESSTFPLDLSVLPSIGSTPWEPRQSLVESQEQTETAEDVLSDDGAESTCPTQASEKLSNLKKDPFLSPELMDMLRLALDREKHLPIQPHFLQQHDEQVQPQHFINGEMRKLTVGWVGEVVREYGLTQETLFLAWALLDRFLSCSKAVPRICLQLVAVACIQLAAKSEEVVHPSVKSFCYIAGNAFSPADLIRTEFLVLRCLGWRTQLPTAHVFLSIYKFALGLQPQTVALACYLLELAQLEYDLLVYRPSQMAAAASSLASLYYNQQVDLQELSMASNCDPESLSSCIKSMLTLQTNALLAPQASPPAVVREEYRQPKWLGAACVAPYKRLPISSFPKAVVGNEC